MRIAELQSLRVLAILMIVASHLGLIGIMPFDAGGDCGTAFFFILSGFVTYLSQYDKLKARTYRHKDFLQRRIRKILPWHVGTWIVAVLLSHSWHSLLAALPSLFLVQSWIPRYAIYFGGNPVSWFLSDLLLAWMLLPWLYKWVQKRWSIVVVLGLYAIYTANVSAENINAWLYVFPPVRIVDFLLGMYLSRLFLSTETGCESWYDNLLVIVSIVCITLGCVFYEDLEPHLRNAAVFWPFLLMILFAAARHAAILKPLCWRPLVRLGDCTMVIFLTHWVLLRFIALVVQI